MKKLILFAAILFAGVSVVKADGPVATATTTSTRNTSTLTVKLGTFQHILVTGSATIEYTNQSHYLPNANVVQNKVEGDVIVSVSSAGGFTVNAIAPNLIRTSGEGELSTEFIQVSALKIGDSPDNDAAKVSNLKTGGSVIQSATGGMDINYKLLFEANGGEVYRAMFDSKNTASEVQEYQTTVTYTITAS